MKNLSFYDILSTTLLKSEQTQIISIMDHDPLLEDWLIDGGFTKYYLDLKNEYHKTTLVEYALTALDLPKDILKQDLKEKKYLPKAVKRFDELRKNQNKIESFKDAGLISLALYERWIKIQSWKGLCKEIGFNSPETISQRYHNWQTILSILFCASEFDSNLLHTILEEIELSWAVDMVFHLVNTQFLPFDKKVTMINELYEEMDKAGKVCWLQFLAVKYPLFGRRIVENQKNSAQYTLTSDIQKIKDVHSANNFLIEALLNAYHYLLLDSKNLAKQYFDLAAEVSIKVLLNVQVLRIGVSENYELTTSEKDNNRSCDYFEDVLSSNGYKAEPYRQIFQNTEQSQGIIYRLETILEIAHSGEKARAVELAKIEFSDWLQDITNRGIDFDTSAFLLNLNHAYLVSLLEKLDLFNLVEMYLSVLDHLMGTHQTIQEFIFSYYENHQNLEKIYLSIKKSLVFTPGQREKHQKLIDLLTMGQFWESAKSEWQVFSEDYTMSDTDWIQFAKIGCKAKDLPKAKSILEDLENRNFDPLKLFGIRGQIKFLEGDYLEAKKNLKDAVKYYPDQAESWVTLSEVYVMDGDNENALASLKSGIFASPDHADLYFNLAKLYLHTQSYSEALKHLRKAVVLNQYNPAHYYPLINTLQTVGLWEEAYNYLSFARKEWPSERKFAFLDAKRLLEEGQRKEAISVLKIATEGDPKNVPGEWYLLLVETILNQNKQAWSLADDYQITTEQLLTSQKTLQNLLSQNNENLTPIIKIMLSEIYFLLDEYERSKVLFEEIFSENKSNIHNADFGWRVFAGLGVVRAYEEQYEEALVLLAQASKLNSANLAIKRKLAEIYVQANLPDEALKVANEIFNARRDDLEIILWFADFAQKINRPLERISALEQAMQFSHQNSFINNQLAIEYIHQGREDEAIKVLEDIAVYSDLSFQNIRCAVTTFLRIDRINEALSFYKKGLLLSTYKGNLESETELIYLYYLNGMWEDALNVLTKAGFEGYEFRAYHTIQGLAYKNLGKIDAALTSLNQALELNDGVSNRIYHNSDSPVFIPENWFVEFENKSLINAELINLFLHMKDLDKAIFVAENMIEDEPENWKHYFFSIELYIRNNNYRAAFNKLDSFRALNNVNHQYKGLAFAFDIFLAYMLKSELPEMEYIENQNMLLSHAIDAFTYINEHQAAHGFTHFQNALNLLKQKNTFSQPNKRLDMDVCEAAISYRLLFLSANELHDYPTMDWLYKEMQTNIVFENELPFIQVVFNLSYRCYEWLFDKLDIAMVRSNFLYPFALKNAVEVTLLPHIEKITNTEQRQFLEMILSGFESHSNEKLMDLYEKNIPKLGGMIILELIKRNEISCVDQLLIRFEDYLGSMIYAAHLLDEYPLEAKLALDRLPDFYDPVFLYLKGIVNYKNNLIDVAILDIKKALSIWNNQVQWKLKLAVLLTEAENIEEACIVWQELLTETTVDNGLVLIPYLTLLVESNQISEAERLLSTYQHEFTEEFNTYMLMAKVYYKVGNFEKTLEACKRAEHFKKDSTELNFWKAKTYYKLNQFEKSAQFAKTYVDIHPENIEATKLLIISNKKSGRLDDTIRLIDLAIGHIPLEQDLQLEKLEALISLGRYDEATKYSSELKEKFYDHPDFNAKIADLYLKMGDFYSAEHAAKAALRNGGNDYPELRMMLAKILIDQGQYDQALHHLSEVVVMNPDHALACFEMGKVYYRKRDFQKALVSYQEAIKRDANDPQVYYEAGLIMREIKDYQGAEKMLRIASELNPKDTNIRRQLAGVVALNFIHTPAEVK